MIEKVLACVPVKSSIRSTRTPAHTLTTQPSDVVELTIHVEGKLLLVEEATQQVLTDPAPTKVVLVLTADQALQFGSKLQQEANKVRRPS